MDDIGNMFLRGVPTEVMFMALALGYYSVRDQD